MQGVDLLLNEDPDRLRVVRDDVAGDAGGAYAVGAADLDRALPHGKFGYVSERRRADLSGDDERAHAVQPTGGARVPGNDHVVRPAVYRDGRYGLADQVLAELEGDLARGEAEERGLLGVDLDRNLGTGLRHGVLDVDDVLDGAERRGQIAGDDGDVVVVGAGDDDVHAACRRTVHELRDAEGAAGLVELLPEDLGDVLRRVVPEGDEELGTPGRSSAGEEAELRRADGHRVEVGDVVQPFFDLDDCREGLLRCGPRRQRDLDLQAVSLSAEQVDRDDGSQTEARQRDQESGEQRDEPAPQHPSEDGGVDALQGGLRQYQLTLVARSLRKVAGTEEVSAEDGDRRQRDEQRGDEREGDGEREGREEGAEETRDERQREEHDDRGHGGGEDGGADLRGGFQRRAPPLAPALYVAVDVLEHDDGVVHDASHGDGESSERHEVERHVLREHEEDAGQDAQRDRERDDHGGAERVEEPAHHRRPDGEHEGEDHGNGEEEAEYRFPGEGVDLTLDLGTLVGDDDNLDVRRQSFDAVQRVVDRSRHVHGVGVRLFGDGDADAGLAVRAVDAVGYPVTESDGGHVSETHDAGRGAPDDEVLDVLYRLQRVGRLGDDGLRAVEDDPGGKRQVVLAQRTRDLEQGDVVGRHLVGVHRDAHATVHGAGEGNVHHAVEPGDLRHDARLDDLLYLRQGPVRYDAELDHRKVVRIEAPNVRLLHTVREGDPTHGSLDG